jgi:hypothetical protein
MIRVYSNKGELVYTAKANASEVQISTQQWGGGLYLLEVESLNKGKFRQRFVVK